MPDDSTLCRRQRMLNVIVLYRCGKGPLHLLIDGEAFPPLVRGQCRSASRREGQGEWSARRHVGPKRRVWRKIFIGIDEETWGRTVEATINNVGDTPMLPDLLDPTPPDQDIGSVTAGGAYETQLPRRDCCMEPIRS